MWEYIPYISHNLFHDSLLTTSKSFRTKFWDLECAIRCLMRMLTASTGTLERVRRPMRGDDRCIVARV